MGELRITRVSHKPPTIITSFSGNEAQASPAFYATFSSRCWMLIEWRYGLIKKSIPS